VPLGVLGDVEEQPPHGGREAGAAHVARLLVAGGRRVAQGVDGAQHGRQRRRGQRLDVGPRRRVAGPEQRVLGA
jgi:hypothetical protein